MRLISSLLRRVLTLPAETPKINFAAYKSRIAVPGMVDEFEKQYAAIQVPYPADTFSSAVDEMQKQAVCVYCTSFIHCGTQE